MCLPAVVESTGRVLRWQSLTVDLDSRCMVVAGHAVAASPGEVGLLFFLLRCRNLPVTKEAVLIELFGPAHGREERLVDALVMRLGRTLRAAGFGGAIVAVAGRGYAVMDEPGHGAGGGPRADQLLLAA